MTEEIKKILEYYQKDIDKFEYYMSDYNDEQLKTTFSKNYQRYKNHKILLNYITNLQKEKDNYKQRNEKAVEWCECVVNAKYTADKLPNGKMTDMGYCLDLAEPLLNILKGGDE